jgi:dTDP-4-dehydrorhamnose 3,5-epimerase-like enzyme
MIPIWIDLQVRGDDRGSLVALETGRQIPFPIRRVYYIFGTKPGVVRGLHAHRKLRQMTFVAQGSCDMLLDDGRNRVSVRLDDQARGLMLDRMVWHEMSNFSPDCVLVVVAETEYDAADYIRNYQEFLRHVHPSHS